MHKIPETPERHAQILTMLSISIELEKLAVRTYMKLSEIPALSALSPFFRDMARQEGEHIDFWKQIVSLVESHKIKNPFDDPVTMISSLESIRKDLEARISLKKLPENLSEAFLLVFELEFSLLDPAFGALFILLAEEADLKHVSDAYADHLQSLSTAVFNQSVNAPHFDLIARQMHMLLKLNQQRAHDLAELYSLRNILPICMHCKKVRDDDTHWQRVEHYLMAHSGVQPSHGICPECAVKYYGDLLDDKKDG